MTALGTRPGSWVGVDGTPVDAHLAAVTAILAPYAEAGVFGVEEHHVTAALLRLGAVPLTDRSAEGRPDGLAELVLALALAVRAPGRGHVCVDLRTAPERLVVDGADGDALDRLTWPDDEAWVELVAGSSLVAQAPWLPALTCSQPVPVIWTGSAVSAAAPLEPWSLRPQHHSEPSSRVAQTVVVPTSTRS